MWQDPEKLAGKIIVDTELENSLLHDLKSMFIDLQNCKEMIGALNRIPSLVYHLDESNKDLQEQINTLSEKMNILLLENAKLKVILEDICQEQSKINNKKRR